MNLTDSIPVEYDQVPTSKLWIVALFNDARKIDSRDHGKMADARSPAVRANASL